MFKRVIVDFETRSMCELKKAGAYKYSLHPTTQPTCMAFKTRDGRVHILKFATINKKWEDLPSLFKVMWRFFIIEGFEFAAHNAFFEQCIYYNILVKRYGWPDIPRDRWRCTAAKAAACALPRSLEGAGHALNLSTQKDKNGYVAMMATCKPTKKYNAWRKACAESFAGKKIGPKKRAIADGPAPPVFLEYNDDPETWETLYRYCVIDVRAEEKLDETLPDLIPEEQEIWFLNQRLNWDGLRVDIPTIEKIVGIMAEESRVKLKELDVLTMGLVTKPGARKSILKFLALEDIILPDIRANTVADILKGGNLSPDMRRLLEIRKALSKTSTKKYQGFIDRAGEDHRVRDILLYHGASTGRDTGTGIQPHNFPRGVISVSKDRPYAAVENVVKCDAETLRLLYGDGLALLFSSILRNMIVPSEGCDLFVADFSKIEVAVLWWLAENKEGLEVLKSGRDPYVYQAAANLGKSYEEIETAVEREERWALDARQLGKAQILGAGFRMGWLRFKKSAYDTYRLSLTNKQSVEAIKKYREANATVPKLWKAYEDAAIKAAETGSEVRTGKCVFKKEKGFLWITLPSGRKLAYRSPHITWRVFEYDKLETHPETGEEVIVRVKGEPRKTVTFMGLDKSKKNLAPESVHGGIWTENVVQACARDLMAPAMVRLEKAGYKPLLAVHDEGICENEKGIGNLKEFVEILCERPTWADANLPIDAKGWVGPRYRK